MTARLVVIGVVAAVGAFAVAYVLAGGGSSGADPSPARAVKSLALPAVSVASGAGSKADDIPALAPAPTKSSPSSGGATGGTSGGGSTAGGSGGGGGGGSDGGGVIEG